MKGLAGVDAPYESRRKTRISSWSTAARTWSLLVAQVIAVLNERSPRD